MLAKGKRKINDPSTPQGSAQDDSGLGWTSVELADEKEIAALRRLLEMLQIKIVEVLEATNQLKASPDYELYNLSQRDAPILDTVGEKQKQEIEAECAKLTGEAQDLEKQIEELTGEAVFGNDDG